MMQQSEQAPGGGCNSDRHSPDQRQTNQPPFPQSQSDSVPHIRMMHHLHKLTARRITPIRGFLRILIQFNGHGCTTDWRCSCSTLHIPSESSVRCHTIRPIRRSTRWSESRRPSSTSRTCCNPSAPRPRRFSHATASHHNPHHIIATP
jgi:hypothetical protein